MRKPLDVLAMLLIMACLASQAMAQGLSIISKDGRSQTKVDTTGGTLTTDSAPSGQSLTTQAMPGGNLHIEAVPGATMRGVADKGASITAKIDPTPAASTKVDEVQPVVNPPKPAPVKDNPVEQALVDGDTISFDGVLFEHDKDRLTPASAPAIAALAAALKARPDLRVRVEGHTDNEGSAEYNLDLSKRRAQSVVKALVAQGISRSVVEVVGLGLSRPIASNTTEEGRARNRRVDVVRIDG